MNLDWLSSAGAVAVTAGLLGVLPRLMRDLRARSDRPAPTKIAPEPWTMGLGAVFCGAASMSFLILPLIDESISKWVWWGICPFWGALCLACASQLTKGASIEWSEQSLTGPASEWTFTPWIRRNEIEWEEATSCGTTPMRSWFLESRDGRRVYWSCLHRGWGLLRDEIRKRRPDLRLPIDMR